MNDANKILKGFNCLLKQYAGFLVFKGVGGGSDPSEQRVTASVFLTILNQLCRS